MQVGHDLGDIAHRVILVAAIVPADAAVGEFEVGTVETVIATTGRVVAVGLGQVVAQQLPGHLQPVVVGDIADQGTVVMAGVQTVDNLLIIAGGHDFAIRVSQGNGVVHQVTDGDCLITPFITARTPQIPSFDSAKTATY